MTESSMSGAIKEQRVMKWLGTTFTNLSKKRGLEDDAKERYAELARLASAATSNEIEDVRKLSEALGVLTDAQKAELKSAIDSAAANESYSDTLKSSLETLRNGIDKHKEYSDQLTALNTSQGETAESQEKANTMFGNMKEGLNALASEGVKPLFDGVKGLVGGLNTLSDAQGKAAVPANKLSESQLAATASAEKFKRALQIQTLGMSDAEKKYVEAEAALKRMESEYISTGEVTKEMGEDAKAAGEDAKAAGKDAIEAIKKQREAVEKAKEVAEEAKKGADPKPLKDWAKSVKDAFEDAKQAAIDAGKANLLAFFPACTKLQKK